MKVKISTIVFHTIIVASALMSGCSLLNGGSLNALGDLSKLIPGGAGLSLTENQNDFFMTNSEVKRALLPYEAVPSNSNQSQSNSAMFYGFVDPGNQR